MRTVLAALLAASAAAAASCGASAAPVPQAARSIHPCGTAKKAPARYDHVVWIVMENKSYSDVIGSSDAPFTRSLASACGLATRFFAESHPSLPNYIAMTSGSLHGIADDAGPEAHHVAGASIFSQLGSGWRALQESMPQACDRGNTSLYAVRHNPATYYTNLAASCPRQNVTLGSRLNLSARFTFITPNLCNDTHDCGVSTGDKFFAKLIPRIVRSREYRAGRTAVFITWDEDDGSASNRIPTLVLSPHTKPGTRAGTRFNHYSMLRTTEDMLGLKRIGAAAHAKSMRAAFGL